MLPALVLGRYFIFMPQREIWLWLRDSAPQAFAASVIFQAIACASTVPLASTSPSVEVSRGPTLEESDAHENVERRPAVGGLQSHHISKVVLERYGSFGGCHTVQYSGSAEGAGVLTLSWTIRPDGRVANANIVDSSLDSPGLHDCVLSIVRDMEFPSASEATEVGAWQLSFAGPTRHSRR